MARLYYHHHIQHQNHNWALVSLLLVLLSFSSLLFSAHAGLSFPKKAAKTKTKKPKAPHIVVIMVDDVGVQDVGYNASPESAIVGKTPIVDALAADAIRLKEYYAHPVCTPTRAAFLTGRYAVNVGMPFPLLAHAIAGLDPSIPTLPQILKEQGGYKTHLVGKWHVGNAKKSMLPTSRGFDSFFGCIGGGFDHYTKNAGGMLDLWRGERLVKKEEVDEKDHAINLFSREAIQVIEAHAREEKETEKPLFLFLSYTGAHDPLQADPEFIAKCKDVPNRHRRVFCGMMAQLDSGIKSVTDSLKQQGLWEDTILLYTSDNGGNPIVGGFNYPLRGAKTTSWEGGSRVPGFIRAPKRFNWHPRDFHGLVHVSDWLPTLITAANIPLPQNLKVDGHDLTKAFQNQNAIGGLAESPRQSVLMQHDVFMNATAYRSGCLKLHLGCPGLRSLYLEPDHRLLRVLYEPEEHFPEVLNAMQDILTEKGFDFIENFSKPPIDQFIKYTLTIQLIRFHDFWTKTSYGNFLNTRYQNLTLWHASLADHPPVLDWDTKHGPKVLLYDVCVDPQETRNLAFEGPERVAQVDRLYREIIAATRDAPIQFAGDTIVRLPTDDKKKLFRGQRLETFLNDEEDLSTLTVVKDRLFLMFNRLLFYLGVLLLGVFSFFVLLVSLLGMCVKRARRKVKAGSSEGMALFGSPVVGRLLHRRKEGNEGKGKKEE